MITTKKFKICPACHKRRVLLSEFHSNRASPDGRQYVCKFCVQEQRLAKGATARAARQKLADERMERYRLSPTEAAYIAGFFDGEGMVSICKQRMKSATGWKPNLLYTMFIRLSNSNKPVLDWIGSKTGSWVLERADRSKRRHWVLSLKSNNAKYLLQQMLPFLTVKHRQATHAIAFQERQNGHKNRYEVGRTGPVPRTAKEIAYKEYYFKLLQELKKPGHEFD